MRIYGRVQWYRAGAVGESFTYSYSSLRSFGMFLNSLRRDVLQHSTYHFDVDVYIDHPAYSELLVFYGAL